MEVVAACIQPLLFQCCFHNVGRPSVRHLPSARHRFANRFLPHEVHHGLESLFGFGRGHVVGGMVDVEELLCW